MTVAHCIINKGESVRVAEKDCYFLLGKINLEEEEQGSVKASVSKFILHSNWNPSDIKPISDIAVSVLSSEVDYTEFISPICLFQDTPYGLYNKPGD